MSSDLLTQTYALLDSRGDLSLRELAAQAGVNPNWLDKFSQRAIAEPGVQKVQRLHDFLVARSSDAA